MDDLDGLDESCEFDYTKHLQDIEDAEERESNQGDSYIEDILFKIPYVDDPLLGSPKDIQDDLDDIVCEMQLNIDNDLGNVHYEKILLYMHNYLVNVVLKQFPYIKGMEHSDTYQESLIALRFKAIPNFRKGKGMSFLNFAKLCIRRHLITILNASKNRQRDQSINRAVSLDTHIQSNDEHSNNTFSNLISNDEASIDIIAEQHEAVLYTKNYLMNSLSDLEKMVLEEYLTNSSYKEIARDITERMGDDYDSLSPDKKEKVGKAVDNALWRIRKKAIKIKDETKTENLPIFMKK